MSLMEGTELLLRYTHRFANASDDEINEASNLVIALGHFPLALDQAGAYIEETGCSLSEYFELYQTHRHVMLARRGKQDKGHPASVVTTWSLFFQTIEQTNPAAAELLQLCAFLPADAIPEEFFTQKASASYWPPALQQAVADPLTFNHLLETLLSFSMVRRSAKDHLLSIHQLVQAVQQERLAQKEQRQWATRIVLAMQAIIPRDSHTGLTEWTQYQRYLNLLQICDLLIQQYHLEFPEAADVLEQASSHLYKCGLCDLAEPLLQKALDMRKLYLWPEHPDIATSFSHLLTHSIKQCASTQADLHLQRTLKFKGKQFRVDRSWEVTPVYNAEACYLPPPTTQIC